MIVNTQPTSAEIRGIRSPFTQRAAAGTPDPLKQAVRDRVGEHLLRWQRPDRRMRLLSMPGLNWTFERQVALAEPRMTFMGIERNWFILDAGSGHVPGEGPLHPWWHDLAAGGQLTGYRRGANIVVWADLHTLVTARRIEKRNRGARHTFARDFKRNTAIWIDMCGPICPSLIDVLLRLGSIVDMRRHVVPIAVTVLKGRELPLVSAHARRVGRAEMLRRTIAASHYRRFALDDVIESKSDGGSTTITVLGRLARKGACPEAVGAVPSKDLPWLRDSGIGRWSQREANKLALGCARQPSGVGRG